MAFGDPVNHADKDGSSATSTTLPLTWATTAGNTLVIGLRRGSSVGTTTTVTVSWDGGTTFPSTATLVKSQAVASAGGMFLFYLPNITGATANNTVVKIAFDSAQTCRFAVGEYSGNFAVDQSNSADNGNTANIDSGAITTTQTTALIGVAITGLNVGTGLTQTAPFTAGTSGITWAVEDELDHTVGTDSDVAVVLGNRSGGGSIGAGTYHFVGTLNAGDNAGGIVASFTNAGGAVVVGGFLWQARGPDQRSPAARPYAFRVYVPRGQLQATSTQQANLTFTGSNQNATSRGLSGTLSFVGSLPSRAVGRALSASLTFTGSGPGKAITRAFSAGLTFTGTVAKASTRILPVGVLNFTGMLTKQDGKTLSGVLSLAGSIPSRAITRAQTAALSFTGSGPVKAVTRGLSGALTFSGAVAKQTGRKFSGALSFAGLIPSRAITKAQNATLSFTGSTPGKAISRGLGAALSFTGNQQKAINRILGAASLSFGGALSTVKNGGSHAFQQTLTAGLSFAGAITKRTSRNYAAALTFTGNISRTITRSLGAGLTFNQKLPYAGTHYGDPRNKFTGWTNGNQWLQGANYTTVNGTPANAATPQTVLANDLSWIKTNTVCSTLRISAMLDMLLAQPIGGGYIGLDATSLSNLDDVLAKVNAKDIRCVLTLNDISGSWSSNVWTNGNNYFHPESLDGNHASMRAGYISAITDLVAHLDANVNARRCVIVVELCNEFYYGLTGKYFVNQTSLGTFSSLWNGTSVDQNGVMDQIGKPFLQDALTAAKGASTRFLYTFSSVWSPNGLLDSNTTNQDTWIARYTASPGVDIFDCHLYQSSPSTVTANLTAAARFPKPYYAGETGPDSGYANLYSGSDTTTAAAQQWWIANASSYGFLSVMPEDQATVWTDPGDSTSQTLTTAGTYVQSANQGHQGIMAPLMRAVTRNLTGAISFAGSIPSRTVGKALTAALSFTGSQKKAISRVLSSAALSFSGALSSAKNGGSHAYQQALTAGLSFAGTVSKGITRTLPAAALTSAGSVARGAARTLQAATSFTGLAAKGIGRTLAPAALTFTGAVSTIKNAGSHAYTMTLTAGLSASGAMSKGIGRALNAVWSAVGSLLFQHGTTGNSSNQVAVTGLTDFPVTRVAIADSPLTLIDIADYPVTTVGLTDYLVP